MTIGLVVYTFIRDGKEQTDIRYYLCSLPLDVSLFAKCVRNHWGIENTCHWSLDVTYNEDGLTSRNRLGTENMAWLRRFTLVTAQTASGQDEPCHETQVLRLELEVPAASSWNQRDLVCAGPGDQQAAEIGAISQETLRPPLSCIPWFWCFIWFMIRARAQRAVLVIVIDSGTIDCIRFSNHNEFCRHSRSTFQGVARAESDYDDEHRRNATEHEHDGWLPKHCFSSACISEYQRSKKLRFFRFRFRVIRGEGSARCLNLAVLGLSHTDCNMGDARAFITARLVTLIHSAAIQIDKKHVVAITIRLQEVQPRSTRCGTSRRSRLFAGLVRSGPIIPWSNSFLE